MIGVLIIFASSVEGIIKTGSVRSLMWSDARK
jgi:hypothetical protein